MSPDAGRNTTNEYLTMKTFTVSNNIRTTYVQFVISDTEATITRASEDGRYTHKLSIEAARDFYKTLLGQGFTRKLKQA